MSTAVKPSARWSSMIVSITACCTRTSSAVVGSSNTMSFGSSDSARAIDTRCRMPPDSSPGNRASIESGSFTLPTSSFIRLSQRSRGTWPWALKTSMKWLRIVRTGFSAFMPDCSTIAKPPWRCCRSSSSPRSRMSWPLNTMLPPLVRAGGFCSRVSA